MKNNKKFISSLKCDFSVQLNQGFVQSMVKTRFLNLKFFLSLKQKFIFEEELVTNYANGPNLKGLKNHGAKPIVIHNRLTKQMSLILV